MGKIAQLEESLTIVTNELEKAKIECRGFERSVKEQQRMRQEAESELTCLRTQLGDIQKAIQLVTAITYPEAELYSAEVYMPAGGLKAKAEDEELRFLRYIYKLCR